MSIFGDYKSYKKFEPSYSEWKYKRDLQDAKRLKYIETHPELFNQEDIQRGEILLRAIDIMDEYSQKKAENMEALTEPIISLGLELSFLGGAVLGGLIGKIKPVGKFFERFASKGSNYKKWIGIGIPATIGAVLGTLTSFPLMAWGAKAEVAASRKGRFEAMNGDLSNPKGFAILYPDQLQEAKEKAQYIDLPEDKKQKISKKLSNGLESLKNMAIDSSEYKEQRRIFEQQIINDDKNIDEEMSEEEILHAKKDKQLLLNLVEKIDIASQDYAENSELATQTGIIAVGAAGGILSLCAEKLLQAMKIKSSQKIGLIIKGLSIAAFTGMGIVSAQINKYASRVGRFKIKQELLNNPNIFIYADDEKAAALQYVTVEPYKKTNMFKFLKNAWKDNKEYLEYKKNESKFERKLQKSIEQIELSPEQIKNAKRLQKNTFRTFNEVDEKSQKYAENIEALGQSVAYPISTIASFIGLAFATPYLIKNTKSKIERANNLIKYFGIVMLSTIPAIIINAFITKEQKKASRIADMKAIEALDDYRKFK